MSKLRHLALNSGFPIKWICLVLLVVVLGAVAAHANSTEDGIAALKAQKNDAIFKVQDIVNQPVTHLKRTPEMGDVAYYRDGWFHPGAETPDFDRVDVRTTQQFVYVGQKYVTSDANPGEVFLGSELEFNPMTKYFYTDRSVPKKKLTDDEMLEINQLYRVIGHCNDQLFDLENPLPPLTRIHMWITTHKIVVGAIVGVLLMMLVFTRKSRAPEFEN
jgi:hypothetical protein